jgi:hypothetical protein
MNPLQSEPVPTDKSLPRSAVAADVDQSALVSASRPARNRYPSHGGAPTRPRIAFTLLVTVGYLAVGLLAYCPMLPGSTQRLFDQADGDPAQTVWFLAWTAHAIVTGHNPLFTSAVNIPSGVNLAQAPAVPLLGLIALPVTLAVGPVASATILMALAMPLSATCAYAVIRRWRVWAPAAALGGLTYGFSPYMVGQGVGHLNLVFVPIPPLIVATLIKVLSGPRYPLRWGSALAALITAQYFVSSEILAITVVMSACGIAIVAAYWAAKSRRFFVRPWRPTITALGVTLCLAGAALAYPLWYEFAGPAHYAGTAWPLKNPWFADALDFVVPSPRQAVAPVLRGLGTRLSAGPGIENGAYLGIPLITVLIFVVSREPKSRRIQLAAGLAVVSGILSLGRYLVVDANSRKVPLPFDLVARVPTLDNILPIRFSFTTATCIAAILAFGLDNLYRHPPRRAFASIQRSDSAARSGVSGLTIVLLVVVVTWLPMWPYRTQVVKMLPATLTKALPVNALVLTYPYPVSPEDQAYLWQAGARFSFRLLGMYGLVPGIGGRATELPPLLDPPAPQEFLVAADGLTKYYPAPPSLKVVVSQTRILVSRWDIRAVIVDLADPRGTTVANMFSVAFRKPTVRSGQFDLWVLGSSRSGPRGRLTGGTNRSFAGRPPAQSRPDG